MNARQPHRVMEVKAFLCRLPIEQLWLGQPGRLELR